MALDIFSEWPLHPQAKTLADHFQTLTPDQIRALDPNRWGDFMLLDVAQVFSDRGDGEREWAVWELILRSDDWSDAVAYSELFSTIVLDRYISTAREGLLWAYRWLVYQAAYEPEDWATLREAWAAIPAWTRHVVSSELAARLYGRLVREFPRSVDIYLDLAPLLGVPEWQRRVLEAARDLGDWEDEDLLRSEWEDLWERMEKGEPLGSAKRVVDPQIWAELEEDLRAAQEEAERSEREGESLSYDPPISNLITLGPDPDPTLYEAILREGVVFLPELLRLMYDRRFLEEERSRPEAHAPQHAYRLVRELRHTFGLEFLRPCLDLEERDWRNDLWTTILGKRGCYTSEELEAIARNEEYDPLFRSKAVEALLERGVYAPSHRERAKALARDLLLHPKATNVGDQQTLVSFTIDAILDRPPYHDLYPEIKQAFDKRLVALDVVALRDVHKALGLPPPEEEEPPPGTVRLLVRCQECEGKTEVFAEHVLDIRVPLREMKGYPHMVIYGGFTCPFCGAVNKYQIIQPLTSLALEELPPEEILAIFEGKKPKVAPSVRPGFHPIVTEALGREMHPYAAIDEYKRRILARPKDVGLYIGLANVYTMVGQFEDALSTVEQAEKVAPDNPEVLLLKAMLLHHLGRRDEARPVYERALEQLQKGIAWPFSKKASLLSIAFTGLRDLEAGKESPLAPPWTMSSDVLSLPPSRAREAAESRHPAGKKRKRKRKKKKKKRKK